MPTCSKCQRTAASAEMRRSPKRVDGEQLWLCKDNLPCKARRKEARIHERARKRAASQS